MTIVPNDLDIEMTDETYTKEIAVEVDYRCFFTEKKAFAPMTTYNSITHGNTLQDVIKEGKKEYEKQYLKVEIMQVRIGEIV
ncbi:hypothetical protein [Thalassobellus citreus]|uniref:hypothetical protein n=1 Tax=Thalassobellus citreus TaxID=3367752 RepID=UPI0037B0A1F3